MYVKHETIFCRKYKILRKKKNYFSITVCTEKAVQTIKDAAESKENQSFYFQIKDADLIDCKRVLFSI